MSRLTSAAERHATSLDGRSRVAAVVGILRRRGRRGSRAGRSTSCATPRRNRLVVAGVAIAVGVGGVFALFWAMNRVVDWLPASLREGVRPYVFVGPALVMLVGLPRSTR